MIPNLSPKEIIDVSSSDSIRYFIVLFCRYYKCRITGAENGNLSGKRIAIKDSIAVAGIPMMIGFSGLEGYVPDFDATVVTWVLDEGKLQGSANDDWKSFVISV